MTEGWKAYFPEEGEDAGDAMDLKIPEWKKNCDAEDAAKIACEYDFGNRDGWERSPSSEFTIVIIAPDGKETRFKAWHEPSIDHCVKEVELEKDDG